MQELICPKEPVFLGEIESQCLWKRLRRAKFAAKLDASCPEPIRFRPAAAAWIALAILSGLNLLNYLDRYVMAAVLTPMQRDLGLGDGAAGWGPDRPSCSATS